MIALAEKPLRPSCPLLHGCEHAQRSTSTTSAWVRGPSASNHRWGGADGPTSAAGAGWAHRGVLSSRAPAWSHMAPACRSATMRLNQIRDLVRVTRLPAPHGVERLAQRAPLLLVSAVSARAAMGSGSEPYFSPSARASSSRPIVERPGRLRRLATW